MNRYCNTLNLQEKIGRKENSIMGIIESLISRVGSIMATFRMATCRKAVLIQRWVKSVAEF